MRSSITNLILALAALALLPLAARAEQYRFRYVVVDAAGNTKQVPNGPGGAWGERLVGFGLVPQPYNERVQPTHFVTFRSPQNARFVTVPLKLPNSTPRMEHYADRIVYNYGSYTVDVRFLADASVEVVYNSGFLRPMPVP